MGHRPRQSKRKRSAVAAANKETGNAEKSERVEAEIRGGHLMYREEFKSATFLTLNMRTTKALARITEGMRKQSITDDMWASVEDLRLGWQMRDYYCFVAFLVFMVHVGVDIGTMCACSLPP